MKLMKKMIMATTTLALLLGISFVPATSVSALTKSGPNYSNLCGTGYIAPYPVQKTEVGRVFIYRKGYTICAIHVRTDGKTKYTGIGIRRAYSTSYQTSVRYSYRTDRVYSYAGKNNCAYVMWNNGTSAAPYMYSYFNPSHAYKACTY